VGSWRKPLWFRTKHHLNNSLSQARILTHPDQYPGSLRSCPISLTITINPQPELSPSPPSTRHNPTTVKMSHARIEEVSDSDPEIDDPIEYLPSHLDRNIILPAEIPSTTKPQQQKPSAPQSYSGTPQPYGQPAPALRPASSTSPPKPDPQIKRYQSLYPIYFDSTRSKRGGRRVSSSLATPSPLALTILQALQSILATHPLPLAFEPSKTHPKDWSNPGRVRLQLFSPTTHKPLHPTIHSKPHLYTLIAAYLKSHPTSPQDPLLLPIDGLPPPKPEHLVPPAKPRGWKINDVIPAHSPAMTGGGVNDNFMGDMMKELQNAQGGAGGGSNPLAGMMGALGGMGGNQIEQPPQTQAQGTKRKMDMEKPKPGQGQKDKTGGGLTFGHSK
jgi:signal recognition particle subunit SRP19